MAANTFRLVTEAPKVGRTFRTPRHNFQIRHKPWIIQPFMIAPVLPGETMKNLLVQALAVTPPLKNGLLGWWYEQYYFYVKHRDLQYRDDITQMHLNPSFDLAAVLADGGGDIPANPAMYYAGSGLNWVGLCLERVVDQYFRNEGEGSTLSWVTGEFTGDAVIDGMPTASTNQQNWLDSAKLADQITDLPGDQLPGFVEQEADTIYPGFEEAFAQWQNMTSVGLVTATFEDYLAGYGIKVPKAAREELHKPELIRFVRDWTYPTAIATPGTGAPARGCVWSINERADKDRFFSEPGFLFGVCVCRPKVYLSGQVGSATELLKTAFNWMPALLQGESYTSLLEIEAGHPIMPGAGGALEVPAVELQNVWVDLKDLFEYGDQFVNFDVTAADAGMVAMPAANMQRRYVEQADITALFPAAGSQLITVDGVVTMTIATRLRDTSTRGQQGAAGTLVLA